MDPYLQVDLAIEYRAIIKNTDRTTQLVITATRKAWEEHRGREMTPGELARHLGWDSLTIPDVRSVQDVELKPALDRALVRLIEARRFQNSVRDLLPRPKPKAAPKPTPDPQDRKEMAAPKAATPSPKRGIWKWVRRALPR